MRVPAGSPEGGQFAPMSREEPRLQGLETQEQARARLCPEPGTYYDESASPEDLKSALEDAFTQARDAGLIREDVVFEFGVYDDEVYMYVLGFRDSEVVSIHRSESSLDSVVEWEPAYQELRDTCHQIRDSFAQGDSHKAELNFSTVEG